MSGQDIGGIFPLIVDFFIVMIPAGTLVLVRPDLGEVVDSTPVEADPSIKSIVVNRRLLIEELGCDAIMPFPKDAGFVACRLEGFAKCPDAGIQESST